MSLEINQISDIIKHKKYFTKALIMRFGMDIDTAEDNISDLIYKLLKQGVPEDRMNYNYMWHVLCNMIISNHRRAKISQDKMKEAYLRKIPDIDYKSNITYKSIRKDIYRLTAKQRNTLILRFGFKMTVLEISIFEEVSINVIKSRAVRAQQNLRKLIKD